MLSRNYSRSWKDTDRDNPSIAGSLVVVASRISVQYEAPATSKVAQSSMPLNTASAFQKVRFPVIEP